MLTFTKNNDKPRINYEKQKQSNESNDTNDKNKFGSFDTHTNYNIS